MHDVGNEDYDPNKLRWLVIREDDQGNRYRVGRYATRDEAQRISDSLDQRRHQQLYWVEDLGGRHEGAEMGGYTSRPGGPAPGGDHGTDDRRPLGQIPPQPEEQHPTSSGDEPATSADDRTGRRIRRARPLFDALAHILPAEARDRWPEEWMAEWVDLGEQPLRTRVAYLLRVTLRSGPYFALTLRLAARRQRAR